jgi:hypothetical protein
MVEKVIKPGPNIVDFALAISARDSRRSARNFRRSALGSHLPARACCHCGAALLDGENEDDCSSLLGIQVKTPRLRKNIRKFRAD